MRREAERVANESAWETLMNKWSVGDRITLDPYGEGRIVEVLGGGRFLRVQWPMFDTPQLVTTIKLPKVSSPQGRRKKAIE